MQRSFDEARFFEATGLDLQRLIGRHLGKDSEQQIFEWIALVLGREYFIGSGGRVYIHTLSGWHQYVRDQGWNPGAMVVATDTTSAEPPQPPSD